MKETLAPPRGRSTGSNPANRFERRRVELDGPATETPTNFLRDSTRNVLARNESPDIPFTYSLNPYRGCEHGCAYCYARPTHEYLGFSAGLDFESKILVKHEAASLLRIELSRPRWQPQVIAMSGVTDPYQPVEARLGITRDCLSVLAEFRNPVAIVTKNSLVTRDLDLLAELARYEAAAVHVSVTTLDAELCGRLEPRTSRPHRRLEAIARLAKAGVPCGVMVAPVIPGLTDHEIPAILQAAADAGAKTASRITLRLPGAVADLFEDWLQRLSPARRGRVLEHIRSMRGGRRNDTRFGVRMRGEGPYAEHIASVFEAARRRAGLEARGSELSAAAFRRPGQRGLPFD